MEDRHGMVPPEEWAKTAVHQASKYSCGKCGERFDSPDKVYDHIDTNHSNDAKEAGPGR